MSTPASPRAAVTLVGRDRELGVLRDHLTTATAGQGSLVLIGGEAGIGKTALAETICREAVAQGVFVLIGHCYDLTETPPYGPWVELFGHFEPSDAPSLPAAFAHRGTVGEVSSQAALFQQVLDFTRAAAAERPVLLLLDDLHWADLASLDLLRFLARTLATVRVLLVATYRADELTRRHPLYQLLPVLVREASASRVDLRPLRPEDIGALVQARYRSPEAGAAQLVAYLNERSEGNPFFLGELLRTLEEEDVLRHTEDGWALGALAGVRMPPLLRQVIDGRLERLGEEAQRLLAIAAVIGQDVPLAVWGNVAETDEETLLAVTERAIEAHLASASETSLHFAHALIREALYEGIVPPRRRILHQRVGETLAALPTPDPDLVAFHFETADAPQAVRWLIAAGERAQAIYAFEAAAGRYGKACRLLERIADAAAQRGWLLYRMAVLSRGDPPMSGAYLDEAAQLAVVCGDRALAAGVRFIRAFGRSNNETNKEVLPELAAAVDALEALTPEEHARLNEGDGIPAADESKPWRGSLVFHLAQVGYYAEAVTMGEAFLAETTPPTTGGALRGFAYGGSHLGLGIAYAMLGQPALARESFRAALTAFRTEGSHLNVCQAVNIDLRLAMLPYYADCITERRMLAQEADRSAAHLMDSRHSLLARLDVAPLLFMEGDWAQARVLGEQAAPSAHGAMRGLAAVVLGLLLRELGEREAARSYVYAMLPVGSGTSVGAVQHDRGLVMQRLAVALALDDGNLQAAREWLEAHDRWYAWNGTVLGRSEGHALWAQYYRQKDDIGNARAHAERALSCATDPRQPLALLAAHRLLGELDTNTGRYDDATRHHDESLRLADACAAPYERAQTLLALAELHATTSNEAAAIAAVDEARAICTPLGAKPALARADALAARLSSEPARASQYPGGLSAREVEVLRLVAGGMTDVQVAEHLFLSPRTVGQHLRNIYNKLGVSTRNAAARFAIEHHLT